MSRLYCRPLDASRWYGSLSLGRCLALWRVEVGDGVAVLFEVGGDDDLEFACGEVRQRRITHAASTEVASEDGSSPSFATCSDDTACSKALVRVDEL